MIANKKIIVQVDKKEHTDIKKIAEEERRTISSLTRKALQEYITQLKKQKEDGSGI